MSFYGAARDRLIRVVHNGKTSACAAVSTSFVLTGADRLIGVWCIRLQIITPNATAQRNAQAIQKPDSVLHHLASTR